MGQYKMNIENIFIIVIVRQIHTHYFKQLCNKIQVKTFIRDTRTLICISLFKYSYFQMNKCTIPSITIFTRPCDVIKDTHQHKNCFDEQELMLLLSLKLFDNDSPFKKIRGHNFNNASTRSIRTIYTTYLPDLECHSFLNAFLYLHQAKIQGCPPKWKHNLCLPK